MGEMVASTLAQEGVSRVFSSISTKLDDRASRAHNVARLAMALSRLEFVLEWARKRPITYVSLIRRWGMFSRAYNEGVDKFVADVESACPLRRDTFFPYPFVRKLFQERRLIYHKRVKGSQRLSFGIYPVVSEGRGVEACIWYERFDPERLDKSFSLLLMQRLSESTDIVGTAIDCVRSSASLLNLPAQDAIIGHLTQVRNLQEISDSYASPQLVNVLALFSRWWRPDPLCCQRDGHGPSANSTNSSGLSHLFQEQTIHFSFSCYVSALEYNLPSASDEAGGRNIVVDRTPLKLDVDFTPHADPRWNSIVTEAMHMGSKYEHFPFGSIEQTVDMTRSRSVEFLIRQPEVEYYRVSWHSRHGTARITVEKQRIAKAAVPEASGRYNTRSAAAKRKRS